MQMYKLRVQYADTISLYFRHFGGTGFFNNIRGIKNI